MPCISGWIVQVKLNVPGVGKVRVTLAFMVTSMLAGAPAVENVTLWPTDSNVNVTVVPAVTVSDVGSCSLLPRYNRPRGGE